MILLTITESERQLISGIPEYVTVESSVPATIFYTLDGSDPDTSSEMYVEQIYLTYSSPTVVLKLKAYSINSESDIVQEEWSTLVPNLDRTAWTGKEGINVLPSGETPIDSLAVDKDGNPERQTVIPFQDLDIKTQTSDRIGQEIPDGSTVDFIKFPQVTRSQSAIISSPDSIDFDPTAKMIIIDGYAGFDKQQIRIINRPHGTMQPQSKLYKEKYHYDPAISGDFARYMYNPKTKKLVLYYREARDGRWIVSSQKVDAAKLNFTPSGNPFVFRWISDRAQSRIF